MMDLAVINGLVFIEGGFRKADVGIKDGKFALIAEPGCLPEAERTIDAGGKYVLPGGIDTHVHYRDPGHWERETFEVGTRAAAAGGCTTFFEHPISMPPQWNGEILKNRISICKGEESAANDRHEKGSCVDFCFFGAAGGEHPEAIEPLSHEGIIAYKTFLHEAPEGRDAEFEGLTSANNDHLYRVLEEVKKTGLAVAAHAEDNELVTGFIKRLREQGRQTENIAHCESRPPIVEIEAISKMLKFGKDVGCPIELVHVSSWQAMELAKKAKARREQGVFLVEGPKMFGELPVERRREVYVSENFLRQQGERAEKLLAGCRYETVTDEVMRHMSDTQTPQGILAVAEQFSYQLSDVLKNSPDGKAPELVILETLQDPGNLGTILRAGEGAGVTGIILDRGSADIYSPKVIRSTMGSIYRVPFIYTDDLHQTIGEVKKQGIRLYAAHLKGKHNYEEENYTGPSGFLIGNEANGLTEETAALADAWVRIPMAGKVESLNAAVAASVLLFETARQRRQ